MIDLFTIFSRGGIVLWCFQESSQFFAVSINELIREVFLQQRTNTTAFKHNGLTIKFKLDNEFDLVFLVIYQDVIQLSYADKLLTDVQLEFRDRYKNVLSDKTSMLMAAIRMQFDHFLPVYQKCLKSAELTARIAQPVAMRTFDESNKSKKTVDSMIVRPCGDKSKHNEGKEISSKQQGKREDIQKSQIPLVKKNKKGNDTVAEKAVTNGLKMGSEGVEDETVARKREAFFRKMHGSADTGKRDKASKPKMEPTKKGKENRKWDLSGTAQDAKILDYSNDTDKISVKNDSAEQQDDNKFITEHMKFVGQYKGELPGLDEDQQSDQEMDSDSDEQVQMATLNGDASAVESKGKRGWFSAFKTLVGNRKLGAEDIRPVLDTMRDHLIGKNVAAEIAEKLCQSVASKLEGKVIGTFSGVTGTVRETLREALVQLLSPKRRVDILRDIIEAKSQNRPYTIVFCGVNGVGKSTNLAKISFWLNENGNRVLIAAGDTFRAGAVEQLRTHSRHLNALHPDSVQLYEQGYGKDPAGLAAHAIQIASERGIDVVLVDTAGRMQDNEPLMRALSKLIKMNDPDLILFVGEALVGNEAVDQLVKFNQALADNAAPGTRARLIDGILLTKFDTIDDKVGAAISMTYITGQPIVFVGTGQTYKDLKNLNANAVLHSLFK